MCLTAVGYLTAPFFQLYWAISLDRGFKSKNAISKQRLPIRCYYMLWTCSVINNLITVWSRYNTKYKGPGSFDKFRALHWMNSVLLRYLPAIMEFPAFWLVPMQTFNNQGGGNTKWTSSFTLVRTYSHVTDDMHIAVFPPAICIQVKVITHL